MAGNALLITAVLFLALLLALLGECRFLVPYRALILGEYAAAILGFAAALFLNVFTAVHLACRKLLLKDTGRKLAHVEKQLRSGGVSAELASRLEE